MHIKNLIKVHLVGALWTPPPSLPASPLELENLPLMSKSQQLLSLPPQVIALHHHHFAVIWCVFIRVSVWMRVCECLFWDLRWQRWLPPRPFEDDPLTYIESKNSRRQLPGTMGNNRRKRQVIDFKTTIYR